MTAQVFNLVAVTATLLVLAACGRQPTSAADIERFCASVLAGTPVAQVEAAYRGSGLELIAIAAPLGAQQIPNLPPASLTRMYGVVVGDGAARGGGAAPGCAIYYSDRLLGGDGNVVARAFIREFRGEPR
jgi:hypothetical protein